jgi:exodeoxyribonuclease VII large subunit
MRSLFDPVSPEVLTVSRLARSLRTAIESQFSNLRVEGEISNFKRHSSGHCYFTLKDDRAQLRAVMWRSNASRVFFQPSDGMLVRVVADASIYENRGELQLVVRSMQLAGEGGLQKAFEELKTRLAGEGLFDHEKKRGLPPYPSKVGVVTSGSGAALQDILSVLERRFPNVRAVVCSVQVQGIGAAESICAAIERFNALRAEDELRPDVLIIGRGGGSMEDLWAFNEECVARAIFASEIPIISAVGHETDFSIADFVADIRAATPSMAAELAVPDCQELLASIRHVGASTTSALTRRIERHRNRLKYLISSHGFRRPVDRIRQGAQQVDDLTDRLHRMAARCVEVKRRRWDAAHHRLHALGPERPLRQGYALIEHQGKNIRQAGDLAVGDEIRIRFHDGARTATVTNEGAG